MTTQTELIKKYGLSIRGHLGQHLLIDPNLQRKIVDQLELKPGESVFEIGPGLGAITGELIRRGAKVIAVEKDTRFVEVLKKEFSSNGRSTGSLHLIEGDVLKTDFQKEIFKNLKKSEKLKVIGNLPYYITAPILFSLEAFRERISRAVFTIQKEVAQRLAAQPGSKAYGRLTLGIRFLADVESAFSIPPSCFTPQPEVDSGVVILRFHPKVAAKIEPADYFHLIETAFSQRRKTLTHLLLRDRAYDLNREKLKRIFDGLGFHEKIRGEELLLKDFLDLTEQLARHKSGGKS